MARKIASDKKSLEIKRLAWTDIAAEIARGVPAKVIWEEFNQEGRVPVSYQNFMIQLKRLLPVFLSSGATQI